MSAIKNELKDMGEIPLLSEASRKSVTLSWFGVHFQAKTPKGNLTILNNISGIARPGELLGIMGPSGSGKTTLLNVLSGAVASTGQICVNGAAIDSVPYNQICAYLLQTDILLQTISPREAFMFSLNMRTTLSDRAKQERTEALIRRLGLTEVANNIVGGKLNKGVSGGERKRTCLGIEIIADPSILILDEPTSGLDSFQAARILQILKDEAAQGKTVLLTIHQPGLRLYDTLDRLMLLSEGHLVYNGPRQEAVGYFDKLFYSCPEHVNPPEHFMNILFV